MTTFGLASHPPANQMVIVGNSTVIYYVGVYLIIRDIQLKSYSQLSKEGGLHNVTALAAIQTQKGGLIIAVGESTDARDLPCKISFYFKNKWHVFTDNQTKGTIKQIQLHEGANYCVSRTDTGNQTNIIDFWNYKSEKLLAQTLIRQQITKMSIHPKTPKNIVFSGNTYLKLWELFFQQKMMKEAP